MIRSYVRELETVQHEMKGLRARIKKLRETELRIKQNINTYLASKNQVGVKFEGKAVVLEPVVKRAKKPKEEKQRDQITALQKFGLTAETATQAIQALTEANRGEEVPEEKLKIVDMNKIKRKKKEKPT